MLAYDTFVRMQSALFVAFGRGTVKEIYSAVDWKVIAPLVDAFNRAGTAEQKKQLIAQIVAKAAEHPAQQMRAREDARRKKEEKRKKQER